MTCAFCNYEFCWACGQSAINGDGHFNGQGCGIDMMDASIRPGDHLKVKTFGYKVRTFLRNIGFFLALLIMYIPFLLFFLPVMCSLATYGAFERTNAGNRLLLTFLAFLGFCAGIVLNICFIPAMLIGNIAGLIFVIFRSIRAVFRWCMNGGRPVPLSTE